MKYLYDAVTNAFYPLAMQADYEVAGMWPKIGVEVDEDLFASFQNPSPGKIRVPGKDGYPAWADIPPPVLTAHGLAATARSYRDAFITATDSMMVSDYCIGDTPLTNVQRTELTTTRATYRAWPTVENWPLIELPELPQWLLVEAVNQGYRVPVWPDLPA
jgi:hypothetical protein